MSCESVCKSSYPVCVRRSKFSHVVKWNPGFVRPSKWDTLFDRELILLYVPWSQFLYVKRSKKKQSEEEAMLQTVDMEGNVKTFTSHEVCLKCVSVYEMRMFVQVIGEMCDRLESGCVFVWL